MAKFSWMTIEGINILLVIVIVFQGRTKKHIQYAAFGWGKLVSFEYGNAYMFRVALQTATRRTSFTPYNARHANETEVTTPNTLDK